MERHVLKRQVVEIRVARQGGAFALQETLGRLCRDEAPRILAAACDRACPPGRRIRIDRLELDLGRLAAENLGPAFLAALEGALAIELGARMPLETQPRSAASTRLSKGSGPRESRPGEGSVTEGGVDSRSARGRETEVSLRGRDWQRRLDLLRFYLATGALPWWADSASSDGDMEAAVGILSAEAPEALAGMLHASLGKAETVERLTAQFSDETLSASARLLLAGSGSGSKAGEILASLVRVWKSPEGGAAGASSSALRARFWSAFWTGAARAGRPWNLEAMGAWLWDCLASNPAVAARSGQGRLPPGTPRPGGSTGEAQTLPKEESSRPVTTLPRRAREAGTDSHRLAESDPRTFNAWEKVLKTWFPGLPVSPRSAPDGRPRPETAPSSGPVSAPQPNPFPAPPRSGVWSEAAREPAEAERQADDEAGEYQVENAGLVILWPFLSPCFEDLGLLAEGAFRDEDARARAIRLMQFLVDGEVAAPEWALCLPKVLCGRPLEATVTRELTLSEGEKTEAVKLLEAAVGHWSALGSTSPEGFRESFLRRQGALRASGGDFLLRVERKSYDLLLDRLPWGISLIRLSWMQRPLRVEW